MVKTRTALVMTADDIGAQPGGNIRPGKRGGKHLRVLSASSSLSPQRRVNVNILQTPDSSSSGAGFIAIADCAREWLLAPMAEYERGCLRYFRFCRRCLELV